MNYTSIKKIKLKKVNQSQTDFSVMQPCAFQGWFYAEDFFYHINLLPLK